MRRILLMILTMSFLSFAHSKSTDLMPIDLQFEILVESTVHQIDILNDLNKKPIGFIRFEMSHINHVEKIAQSELLKIYATKHLSKERTGNYRVGFIHRLYVGEKCLRGGGIGKYLFSNAIRYLALTGAERTEWKAQPYESECSQNSYDENQKYRDSWQQKLNTFYASLGGTPFGKPRKNGSVKFFFDHTNPAYNAKLIPDTTTLPQGYSMYHETDKTFFEAQIVGQFTSAPTFVLCDFCYQHNNSTGKFTLSDIHLRDGLLKNKKTLFKVCQVIADKLNLDVKTVKTLVKIG